MAEVTPVPGGDEPAATSLDPRAVRISIAAPGRLPTDPSRTIAPAPEPVLTPRDELAEVGPLGGMAPVRLDPEGDGEAGASTSQGRAAAPGASTSPGRAAVPGGPAAQTPAAKDPPTGDPSRPVRFDGGALGTADRFGTVTSPLRELLVDGLPVTIAIERRDAERYIMESPDPRMTSRAEPTGAGVSRPAGTTAQAPSEEPPPAPSLPGRHRVILGAPVRRSADGVVVREAIVDGWRFELEIEPERRAALRERARRGHDSGGHFGPLEIHAIIPGRIVAISVSPGDPVDAGQQLLVLEAMKMQNELRAPREGEIERIAVAVGDTVEVGNLLMVIL